MDGEVFSPHILEGLKRKELQALCKARGLRANVKNSEMIDLLISLPEEESDTCANVRKAADKVRTHKTKSLSDPKSVEIQTESVEIKTAGSAHQQHDEKDILYDTRDKLSEPHIQEEPWGENQEEVTPEPNVTAQHLRRSPRLSQEHKEGTVGKQDELASCRPGNGKEIKPPLSRQKSLHGKPGTSKLRPPVTEGNTRKCQTFLKTGSSNSFKKRAVNFDRIHTKHYEKQETLWDRQQRKAKEISKKLAGTPSKMKTSSIGAATPQLLASPKPMSAIAQSSNAKPSKARLMSTPLIAKRSGTVKDGAGIAKRPLTASVKPSRVSSRTTGPTTASRTVKNKDTPVARHSSARITQKLMSTQAKENIGKNAFKASLGSNEGRKYKPYSGPIPQFTDTAHLPSDKALALQPLRQPNIQLHPKHDGLQQESTFKATKQEIFKGVRGTRTVMLRQQRIAVQGR